MASGDIGPVERLTNATRNSLRGLGRAWRSEAALRYEVYALCVALPAAMILGRNGAERALLTGTALLIVVVEVLNSAIEAVVDRIGPERHDLSGLAKDLGSAAVFCAIVLALLVWSQVILS